MQAVTIPPPLPIRSLSPIINRPRARAPRRRTHTHAPPRNATHLVVHLLHGVLGVLLDHKPDEREPTRPAGPARLRDVHVADLAELFEPGPQGLRGRLERDVVDLQRVHLARVRGGRLLHGALLARLAAGLADVPGLAAVVARAVVRALLLRLLAVAAQVPHVAAVVARLVPARPAAAAARRLLRLHRGLTLVRRGVVPAVAVVVPVATRIRVILVVLVHHLLLRLLVVGHG